MAELGWLTAGYSIKSFKQCALTTAVLAQNDVDPPQMH